MGPIYQARVLLSVVIGNTHRTANLAVHAARGAHGAAGLDYIGTLPSEVQKITVYPAGIHSRAKQPAAAKALVKSLTVGTMTIPYMKRTGFSLSYSGAIEACTYAGGTTYSEVALAAIIPAFLFYVRAPSLDQFIGAREE